MKQQSTSNEETRDLLKTHRLQYSAPDTDLPTNHSTNGTMMTNDSLDSTGTKMLMPHEMVGSSGGAASLVGQHSIHHNFSDQLHHGTSFYSSPNSFNGYHNSFHSYSTLNSNSTMITNNHTFSNLIHQQMNNNHHTGTVASSVPPLIHQQNFYANKSDKNEASEPEKNEEALEAVKEEPVEEADASSEEQVPVEENEEPEPEIDIVISNVVCAFSVRCHLTLKDIALNGANVEYKRENGMVTMKLRKPYTTASIWSSGKITCTGATSEDEVREILCVDFRRFNEVSM
jgi:Transcription factor TFIID (or TATA-binding protein, TBP)